MKNIIPVFAFLVMAFPAGPVLGQEAQQVREKETGSYVLHLNPVFGMMYGQAEEIVYPKPENHGKYLSQLLWDMKPVFYYGLLLDFSRAEPTERGWFSTLSLKFGIPGLSGKMEDRDWLSIENDALTNYSCHDNTTKEMFLLDVSAGYGFPFRQSLILKAFVNVSYMRFSFSGRDGYRIWARGDPYEENPSSTGKYYPIDDNPITGDYPGKVINYTQEWWTAAPGVSLGYRFLEKFYTELSFQISPLILCIDLDEHLTSVTQFRDYMLGGLFLNAGFKFAFDFNERLGLSLDYAFRHISETKGETYMKVPIDTGTYAQVGEAGAGLTVSDVSLMFKVRL